MGKCNPKKQNQQSRPWNRLTSANLTSGSQIQIEKSFCKVHDLIYKWEMVRTDVRWASHFTRELPFLKVIETHETTQTKGNLICMHHTRSECPRSPGTHLFGQVKLKFISWNHSSRRLKFQLSLKILLFRLEIIILSNVNCLKVGSEQRMTWLA